MPVEELTDRDELRDFLRRDRLANAYLLGNLDPAYFQFCNWYGARDDDGGLRNLMLVYRGLSLPVVFMSGNGEGLEEFLEASRDVVPDRFHFHVLEEQMPALQAVYPTQGASAMLRMGLKRQDFDAPSATDDRVERLGHRDTAAIMELYEHYPDNFFEAYQLETGLYFGIRDDERLVSMGGVHVLSEEHDIAVIGNLVTHSQYRGEGLATAVTARLVDELFERVSLLALNVGRNNTPAVQLYENFGFESNNVFFEGRWEGVDAG